MRKIVLTAALLLAIIPSGAAGTEATIQTDQFDPTIKILGPDDYENPFGGTYRDWRLRSWVDKKTGAVKTQLYVVFRYFGEWRFYEEATTDTAQELEVTAIDRQVETCYGICTFSETIGVTLPADVWSSRASTGLPLKISARDGSSQIIQVSAEQVAAQLAALASLGPTKPSTPSGAPSSRTTLGIYFAPLSQAQLTALHIASDHGLIVAKVLDGSPAATAGIQASDVILSFNGKPVATIADLSGSVSAIPLGTKVNVGIWRGSREIELSVQF